MFPEKKFGEGVKIALGEFLGDEL